ncbi:MAG: hypothetical protein H5T69_12885, partial [Chloroflexi bacterium]|nr:hypothetical protein [Chloroflexota bacterium]
QAGASTAVIQRDDGSVEQILERQGVHAGDYLLSATVRMAPQQILATTDYGTVETGTEGTEVEAYLSAEEFQINFPTPLTFVPRVRGYQIMRSVRIEGFSWNWSQQRVTIRWTGPLLLALIRDQISARVAGRLRSALPARMFAPRYNPFADTRLLEELPTLLGNFSMGEAGGGGMPRTSLTQVSASATLSQPFAVSHPSAPDGQFVIPRDTRLNAVASLGRVEHLAEASRHLPEQTRGEPEWRPLARMVEGQLPPSLEELGIQRINLRFERHAAQVCYAEIPLLMIQEAELTYGGQLRLRYGLPGERTFRALRGEELPLRENELTEFAEEQLRNFILSGGLPETLAIMAGY